MKNVGNKSDGVKNLSHESSVSLQDPRSVWIDDSGKSRAFFCNKSLVRVGSELIEEMKKASSEMNHQDVRLCMHRGPEAPFHDMIILVHRGEYYRPHMHENKSESFIILEGEIAIFVYDETGQVIDSGILKEDGDLIYRISAGMYHSILPLTDIVLFFESKPGPFHPEDDNIYPSWAPDALRDENEAIRFQEGLLHTLKVEIPQQ